MLVCGIRNRGRIVCWCVTLQTGEEQRVGCVTLETEVEHVGYVTLQTGVEHVGYVTLQTGVEHVSV